MFSDRLWQQLVCFGPEGFSSDARLRFWPDPADEDAPTETAQLRAALETLTRHRRTPEDCYFCLWDGWGSDIHGGGGVFIADSADRHRATGAAGCDGVSAVGAAWTERRHTEPRVLAVPGPVSDLGDWGSR